MKKEKLISLEHNDAQAFSQTFNYMGDPELNGVACPKCGEELYDSSPNIILTSSPAQKYIHCSKCGYKGTRFI